MICENCPYVDYYEDDGREVKEMYCDKLGHKIMYSGPCE